jgi:hypothetical protein
LKPDDGKIPPRCKTNPNQAKICKYTWKQRFSSNEIIRGNQKTLKSKDVVSKDLQTNSAFEGELPNCSPT